MKYKCSYGGCDNEVERPSDYCPSCQCKFDAVCDRYRAMRKSVEDENYETQLEAINRFRSGMQEQ